MYQKNEKESEILESQHIDRLRDKIHQKWFWNIFQIIMEKIFARGKQTIWFRRNSSSKVWLWATNSSIFLSQRYFPLYLTKNIFVWFYPKIWIWIFNIGMSSVHSSRYPFGNHHRISGTVYKKVNWIEIIQRTLCQNWNVFGGRSVTWFKCIFQVSNLINVELSDSPMW